MTLVHAIGFDDSPFEHAHRGDVRVVGTVYARLALHAVVSGKVRRDGRNSTDELTRLTALVGNTCSWCCSRESHWPGST